MAIEELSTIRPICFPPRRRIIVALSPRRVEVLSNNKPDKFPWFEMWTFVWILKLSYTSNFLLHHSHLIMGLSPSSISESIVKLENPRLEFNSFHVVNYLYESKWIFNFHTFKSINFCNWDIFTSHPHVINCQETGSNFSALIRATENMKIYNRWDNDTPWLYNLVAEYQIVTLFSPPLSD